MPGGSLDFTICYEGTGGENFTFWAACQCWTCGNDDVTGCCLRSNFAQNFVKVYPNPASSEVQFSVSNLSLNSVGFYDVMGRQHFPSFHIENNTISCDVHDLSNGIYMARLNWLGRINFQNQDYPGSFTIPFIVQH